MNSRKRLLLITLTGITVLILAVTFHNEGITGDTGANPALTDRGEGIWLSYDPYGTIWLTLSIPMDPQAHKRAMVMEGINFDATLDGSFPGVTLSPLRGVAERIALDTFAYTILSYGVNETNEIIYILRGSGVFVFHDADTLESNGSMGFYSPDQDPFSEVEPAYGCWPQGGFSYRMPNVPPCELE